MFNVPVFSIVPKGVKGAPKDIEEADLHGAVKLHQRAYQEDQAVLRLNVLHNFGIHKATGVGFFLPKDVRQFRMRGKVHPVVFADLLAVQDQWFQEMDAGELPYCSVEIRAWDPLEFAVLSLLDTEPPFFNGFPNINIGDRQEALVTSQDITQFKSDQQAPAVAAFVSGAGARFLFRFEQGGDMPDEEKKKDDENEEAQLSDEEGGTDLAAAVKAIEEQMKALEPLIALKDKIAALVDSTPEVSDVETEEDVKEEGPVEMKADADKSTITDARLSALEDFKEAAIREKARDSMFSEAVSGLEDEGYHLSEGSRKRLFTAAEQGKSTLALFLSEYRDTAIKDPPPDLEGLDPGEESWPSEVMAFAAQGPDEFAEAKRVYREWRELESTKHFGGGRLSSLDKYLARNVQKGA